MTAAYNIYPVGDSAIAIELAKQINERVHENVMSLYKQLSAAAIDGVVDIIPAYTTITIIYTKVTYRHIQEQVEKHLSNCTKVELLKRNIEIPVCYDSSYGLDIEQLASQKKISVQQLIQMHSQKKYLVYMIGFLPGFPYMASVDEQLQTPRLKNPRTEVLAGSVGIAGEQTGIYPFDSPGGWNIIGRTPLYLFNPANEKPALLQPGDEVSFKPIDKNEFNEISKTQLIHKEQYEAYEAKGIRIIKAGIADSIQDLGRFGFQHLGIHPTGAMDIVAAQIANMLVGNDTSLPVIEIHFPASSFLFETDTVIALFGANFTPTINDIAVPIHKPFFIKANDILRFTKKQYGVRCYMAVRHGIQVEQWLNSYSTNLIAHAGGYKGRYLKESDSLSICSSSIQKLQTISWSINQHYFYTAGNTIRIVAGREYTLLQQQSANAFTNTTFTIEKQSNRMGYRLSGTGLFLSEKIEMISAAVVRGAIQLLPDGQLIILMADHQTTGGYPVIGYVISADLPKLVQMNAGMNLNFMIIQHHEAEELLQQQQMYLRQLQHSINLKLESIIH